MASKPISDNRNVSEIIKSADIVVFGGAYCGFCSQAISTLKKEGYTPNNGGNLIYINANSEQRESLFESTHSTSIPSIWVKGKYIGGCYDGPESWHGLVPLIENGRFKTMLH